MAALDSAPIANWQNAKLRLEQERKENSKCLAKPQDCSKSIRDWQQKIATWADLSDFDQINAVNRFANRTIRYTADRKIFKKSDYWATPAQSLRGRGDCEDYVLLKYETLLALGFAKQDLRIVVVTDQRKNIAHAVLSVKTAKGIFILDNQDQRVLRHDSIRHYAPLYSINEKGRWMNVATRDVQKRKTAPVVLVADNSAKINILPAAAPRVVSAVAKPVYKKTIKSNPVMVQAMTPRMQAVASIAMLRQSVSVAEREPQEFVQPPTVFQRWAMLLSPLMAMFKQTAA